MIEKPVQPPREFRQPRHHLAVEHLDREERDQPDHRAHLQRHRLIARQLEHVVVEFVGFVPQPDGIAADLGHRLGDQQEMLEELGGDVLVDMVGRRQFERDPHQVERVHRHPGGAVRLVDVSAGRQLRAAVEDADIVEPEEPALEDVAPLGVLAVHPPGEVQHQLVEDAFEKGDVALAAMRLAVDLIDPPCRPAVHRRVDVVERPFIGGELPVGVHVPFAGQQHELLLGEFRVDHCEGDAVKREVPGRIPRVFPLVRHQDHVGIEQMPPIVVAAVLMALGRRGLRGVAAQPLAHVERVELL